MTIYYTADLHLGHEAILDFVSRPFTSIDSHDEQIVHNINHRLRGEDRLYVLGDFAWGKMNRVKHYRELIRCKNVHLIMGNHDPTTTTGRPLPELYRVFQDVRERKLLKDHLLGVGVQRIYMDHYPVWNWPAMDSGSYHLHGHVHGSDPSPREHVYDVGVDCWDYKPVTLMEIVSGRIES